MLVQTSAHGTPHRATCCGSTGIGRACRLARAPAPRRTRSERGASTTSTTVVFTAAASPRPDSHAEIRSLLHRFAARECRRHGGVPPGVLRRAHRRRLRRLFADVSDVPATVAFLDGLVAARPARILELAVGTGRLAIPLAALGHDVTGSTSARRCSTGSGPPTSTSAVTGVLGDMVDDLPAGPFDLVFVAFNSLFMLDRPGPPATVLRGGCAGSCSRRRVRRRGLRAVGSAPRRVARRGALDDRRPSRARRRRDRPGDADGARPVRRAARWPARAPAPLRPALLDSSRARRVGGRPPACASPSATPTSSAPRSPTTRRSTSACFDEPEPRAAHTAGFRCTISVPVPSYPESQL